MAPTCIRSTTAGIMWCLDVRTGQEVYGRQRLRPATYSGSPVLADGKIYVTDEDGVTSVIQAGPTFVVLAENDFGEYTLSSPAISDGQIFIRTDAFLYAIGQREAMMTEAHPTCAVAAIASSCGSSCHRRRSGRPGAGGPDGGRRRRRREVLAALARAVGSGAGDRQRLPRHLVGHAERAVEGAGSGQRQLVADRLGRSHFPDDGVRRRAAAVACSPIRRSDGAQLWETVAPEGRTDRGAHYKNGHASATPATDGQRVYVSFGTRGLIAVDFNGKIVWQRDLGRWTRTTAPPARRCSTRTGSSSIRISRPARSSPRSTRGPAQQLWRTRRERQRRLGHADRHPRRRSRRDHRQQPEPRARVRPRHGHASSGAAAAARTK